MNVNHGFIPQKGPQAAFVASPAVITVYGGARGGGKTHGSLGDFWLHAELYHERAHGLMIRKTREDLKDTIARGEEMYAGAARYIEKGNYFRFLNGARLYCAYLENEQDAAHYQGWNLTRVYIEELTQFLSPEPILRLLGTLRSSYGVPCRMKCTCNPGGPGHVWVKDWVIDLGAWNVYRDPDNGLTRVFIPARLADNPALMSVDPGYVDKLRAVGSPQLVKAWLDGDWDIIEGAFFPEFNKARHVITPFKIPSHWVKFRSMDWGSAHPFSIGWWAVAQDTVFHDERIIPRGAIIRYREWYGCQPGKTNVGLKLPAEQVAAGIRERETNGSREEIEYGVLDPSAFAVVSGPSIGETLATNGVIFRRADNNRLSRDKRMGGHDQVRARLRGNDDNEPMIFFFSTCTAIIRTLPIMQHDKTNSEDLDTDAEDHAVDDVRYACMSRPYLRSQKEMQNKNVYLVSNAFRLGDLS